VIVGSALESTNLSAIRYRNADFVHSFYVQQVMFCKEMLLVVELQSYKCSLPMILFFFELLIILFYCSAKIIEVLGHV
jgi:hypothetical protein